MLNLPDEMKRLSGRARRCRRRVMRLRRRAIPSLLFSMVPLSLPPFVPPWGSALAIAVYGLLFLRFMVLRYRAGLWSSAEDRAHGAMLFALNLQGHALKIRAPSPSDRERWS